MKYSTCHRCHGALPPYDDGTLTFCPHCGAPQISLSEELQTQAELQATAAAAPPTADAFRLRNAEPGANLWRGALRCAALASAVAAGLAICARVLPPVAVLVFFWSISSPVVVIGLFQARFPRARITPGFGARLGLVTGVGVFLATATVNTVAILLARAFHAAGSFDSWEASVFDQFRAQAAAQAHAQPGAPDFTPLFAIPEFRAGSLIGISVLSGCLLIALTTVGGAFAGFLRSRRNA